MCCVPAAPATTAVSGCSPLAAVARAERLADSGSLPFDSVFGELAPSSGRATPPSGAAQLRSCEGAPRSAWSACGPAADAAAAEYASGAVLFRLIQRQLLPRDAWEASLCDAVRAAEDATSASASRLAACLRDAGFAAHVVSAAGHAGAGLALRHTFIVVEREPGALASPHLARSMSDVTIVEPHLRSHFEVGRPSPLYRRLLDDLPERFVGGAEQLAALVEFICDQMSTSFQECGMSVPPWRGARALLSKWSLGEDELQGSGSSPPRRHASPQAQAAARAPGAPPPRPPTFARRVTGERAVTAEAAAVAKAAAAATAAAVICPPPPPLVTGVARVPWVCPTAPRAADSDSTG